MVKTQMNENLNKKLKLMKMTTTILMLMTSMKVIPMKRKMQHLMAVVQTLPIPSSMKPSYWQNSYGLNIQPIMFSWFPMV